MNISHSQKGGETWYALRRSASAWRDLVSLAEATPPIRLPTRTEEVAKAIQQFLCWLPSGFGTYCPAPRRSRPPKDRKEETAVGYVLGNLLRKILIVCVPRPV